MSYLRICALVLALTGAGCAIRPLPEDVSGVPTDLIVQRIRCETRQAIIDSALGWLTAEDNLTQGLVDERSRNVGLEFRSGRPINQFRPALFYGRVRNLVQLFYDTGIAYHFELQMTENNDLTTEVNLIKPAPPFPQLDLGLNAGALRQRDNLRVFAITDTFAKLMKIPGDYCDGNLVGRNYLYPITGNIGTKRLVQDFINLTLFQALAGAGEGASGPPTLSDQLEFLTVLSGSASPKVTFAPVTSGFGIVDASLIAAVKRTDRHKLTMALAVAGPGAALLPQTRSSIFYTPLLSAKPQTNSEAAAAEAVNQVLTLRLFRPNINVVR